MEIIKQEKESTFTIATKIPVYKLNLISKISRRCITHPKSKNLKSRLCICKIPLSSIIETVKLGVKRPVQKKIFIKEEKNIVYIVIKLDCILLQLKLTLDNNMNVKDYQVKRLEIEQEYLKWLVYLYYKIEFFIILSMRREKYGYI